MVIRNVGIIHVIATQKPATSIVIAMNTSNLEIRTVFLSLTFFTPLMATCLM